MYTSGLTISKREQFFTGYEEDEDFQWICDYVDSFKKRAAREGGNFPFRLKACLTEDALTPVPGRGLLRQTELFSGMSVEGYESSEITDTKPQGLSKVLTLETSDGTVITGTPEHPVLTNYMFPDLPYAYSYLKDLKSGSVIYSRLGTRAFGTDTLPQDKAKFIGYYLGCGYVMRSENYNSMMFEVPKDQELLEDVIATVTSVSVPPTVVLPDNKSSHQVYVPDIELSRHIYHKYGFNEFAKRTNPILRMDEVTFKAILKCWFSSGAKVVRSKNKTKNSS